MIEITIMAKFSIWLSLVVLLLFIVLEFAYFSSYKLFVNVSNPSLITIVHFFQELEEKRKQRAQVTYERKKQLNKLRKKAETVAEEQLGAQIDVLNPIKY